MSNYRRVYVHGGCYFFTLVTWKRIPFFSIPNSVEILREAFRKIKNTHPFSIDGIVILPEHLHCILQLPEGDTDFSGRWREIKKYVSKRIPDKFENWEQNRGNGYTRKENKIWQRRFWEHIIRDDSDWQRHMDYIHYNPVKHELAKSPAEWPYSSFSRSVKMGWYKPDWGSTISSDVWELDLE